MVGGEGRARLRPRWLNRGVAGIGLASFFSDVSHEVPTSLLPALLTTTLGAPAAALGTIEGIADGLSGVAKIAGGALADDPARRRATAMGGYTATSILSALIGLATSVWQVAVLRTGAWISRGLRTPSRNALLTDVVEPEAFGRAYGFERALDNAGAIAGPLLALLLVSLVGVRDAILLSVIPGLMAAAAVFVAIKSAPRLERHERPPLRIRIRPVLRGRLGRLFVAVTAFELGNAAATLLILRATDLLEPAHGHDSAVQLAVVLYAVYNAAAMVTSVPAGHVTDRRGATSVLVTGALALLRRLPGLHALRLGLRAAGRLLRARRDRQGRRRDRSERGRRPARADRSARLGVRRARWDPELRQPRRLGGRRRALDARLPARGLPVPGRLGGRERGRHDRGAPVSAQGLLQRELERFEREHPRSRELALEARESLLSGVPMPWMIRWPGGFPVFAAEAHGARFTDVDGHEYVDFCLGDTAAMTGHSPEPTVRAVAEQAARGSR